MSTAVSEIQALTAAAFSAPDKFEQFCRNGGQPTRRFDWRHTDNWFDERNVPDD